MALPRTTELNPVLAAAKGKMMPTGPNNELRARLAVLMSQAEDKRAELVETSYGQEVAEEYYRLTREKKQLYDEEILAKAKAAVEARRAEEAKVREACRHEEAPEAILATLGQQQEDPEHAFEGAKESSEKSERRREQKAAKKARKAARDARRGAQGQRLRPEPTFPEKPARLREFTQGRQPALRPAVVLGSGSAQTPRPRPSEPEVIRRQLRTNPERVAVGRVGETAHVASLPPRPGSLSDLGSGDSRVRSWRSSDPALNLQGPRKAWSSPGARTVPGPLPPPTATPDDLVARIVDESVRDSIRRPDRTPTRRSLFPPNPFDPEQQARHIIPDEAFDAFADKRYGKRFTFVGPGEPPGPNTTEAQRSPLEGGRVATEDMPGPSGERVRPRYGAKTRIPFLSVKHPLNMRLDALAEQGKIPRLLDRIATDAAAGVESIPRIGKATANEYHNAIRRAGGGSLALGAGVLALKNKERIRDGFQRVLPPAAPEPPSYLGALRRLATPRRLALLGAAAGAGTLAGASRGGGLREPDLFGKQSRVRRVLYEVEDPDPDDPEESSYQTLGADFRSVRSPFFEAAPVVGGAGAAGIATLLTRRLPQLARVPRYASIAGAALAGLGTGFEVRRHGPREDRVVALLNGTTPQEAMSALRIASHQMSPAAYQTLHGDYPTNLRVVDP